MKVTERRVFFEIEGIKPLLMHKMEIEIPTEEEIEKGKKKQRKKTLISPEKEAQKCLYKNGNGIFAPGEWIHRAMVAQSVNFKMAGKKTYKDYVNGGVDVDDELELSPQEYELFTRNVRIGSARVPTTRPTWNTWKISGFMTLTDDLLEAGTVKEILEHAAYYNGFGDWRPKFGKGKLTKFEEEVITKEI